MTKQKEIKYEDYETHAVQIPGYCGYLLDTDGNVWSFKQKMPRLMKHNTDSNHYLSIVLSCYGRQKRHRIHRLLAKCFLSFYTEDLKVNHIDGNKQNNLLSNLEMCTQKENIRHWLKNSGFKHPKGPDNKNAKLTLDEVREVRDALRKKVNAAYLSRIYGISETCMYYIKSGKTYKGVE